jgi:outer membrane lipoprotein SlyB
MKTRTTLSAALVAACIGTGLLGGCAAPSQQSQGYPSSRADSASYGTIDSIQPTRTSGKSTGLGTVAGGVVGALLGNQVGSGGGRTAATVAGAVGGAVVGNQVEQSRTQAQDAYQINVRLDNGDYRTLVQDSAYDLHPGDRIRVVDGRAYRY